MASKITANTLKVTLREDIKLNNIDKGSVTTLSIDSINEVDSRIMTALSSSEQSLFKFSGAVGAGTFISSSFKYGRITNMDDTYPVRVRVSSSLATSADFSVNPGGSFLLTTTKMSGSLDGLTNYQDFDNITDVLIQASGSDVDVEYFIAST
jgi:hypothetical protein